MKSTLQFLGVGFICFCVYFFGYEQQRSEYVSPDVDGSSYNRSFTEPSTYDFDMVDKSLPTVDYFGNEKLHQIGELVNCMYAAIYSWDSGDEFVKTVPMQCEVMKVSYGTHLFVDCSDDLEVKWSERPGHGLVKNHPLNKTQRWYALSDCYEIVGN